MNKAQKISCVSTNSIDPIFGKSWNLFFRFFSYNIFVVVYLVSIKKLKRKKNRSIDPLNFGPVSGNATIFFA